MRARLTFAVPAVLISALALAGCATPSATPSPTASESSSAGESTAAPTTPAVDPAADLCGSAFPSGSSSESVTVTGAADAEPKPEFTAPLSVSTIERTVVTQGTGEKLVYGQLVNLSQTIYDATTGEKAGSAGYDAPTTPIALTAETGYAQALGCATIGSRIVITTPSSNGGPSYVYVMDVKGVVPTKAWGKDQPAVDGMPTVTLAEDGTPSVTIPKTDAPTEVKLSTLKEGDGAVVGAGDNVTVQYMGVKWSDGSEFDSSWSRGGEPTSFATNQVVDGFRQALEGYKVGSQVLVVVPPAAGYGATEGHELQKETLVFVVDILATTPAAK